MMAPMRDLARVAIVLGMTPLLGTSPVPRKSPDLTFRDPAGNQTSLSNFKDKVVLVEFLVMDCPHCVRVTQTVNKLYNELGPRGFQAIGIAFDNPVNGPLVAYFAQYFKITFPVGYTSSDKVDTYLGRPVMQQFQVPQIVVIDGKGVIRAQSHPTGETNLEDETYLRNLIETLLREGSPVSPVSPPSGPHSSPR